MRYTVGIDPDTERHGLAVYDDGKLIVCATATDVELVTEIIPNLLLGGGVVVSIENVLANSFVYSRNRVQWKMPEAQKKKIEEKIAVSVGRCQQAQLALMRWLDFIGVPYVLHKPQAGNWKDKKDIFERITGWTGRSNDDSRAAAFFGYLSLKKPVPITH